MRKVNTRGIEQANKCMLMAGSAFNVKKLLKFSTKKAQNGRGVLGTVFFTFLDVIAGLYLRNKASNFFIISY